MKAILDEKIICDEYQSTNIGIEAIALKYHVGKKKINEILAKNNIPHKRKGAQKSKETFLVSDWSIKKYNPSEGFHYMVYDPKTDFVSKDINNNGGVLTSYIEKEYNIPTPTLYDRRMHYMRTGNYWWEQWLSVKLVKNEEVKKCPYCDWETIDIENKSGAFEQHLLKCHNITKFQYIEQFPEEKKYFALINPALNRQMEDDENDFVVSKIETEIKEFIKSLGFEANTDRKILNGKEIDVLIPSLKIAFEIDGLRWHNEITKDNNYHLRKTEQCKDCGISLYHIFEDEWEFKRDIVESRIRNILNCTQNKIFARKCQIKTVDKPIAMRFLDENHLQGKCGSIINYGLYYNNELVSLMTFGKQRKNMGRNDTGNTYELIRFCNKLNTNVVGGASKLFKHFIKEFNPSSVISYADRRWSNGDLYTRLNFSHVHNSRPNYFYIIGHKRKNRFGFRKDILVKEGYDANKSEHQIMFDRGIYRIYDCGTMLFEYKNIYNKKIADMKSFIKESEIRRYIKSLINETRAYHGSQARFSKFDSSFNGNGEGSAAFGPGHYFTNSKNIAKDYAMEHGTSQAEIPKIIYKGVDGDSIYQAHLLFNALNKCVQFEDYDKQHHDYLWQSLPKLMCTANSKNEFIATVYQYLIDAVKDKEDYEEDKDWYDYSLKKALKLLQSKIEEATRTLYQVELPDEDKFADWLMEVPEEWYGTLRKMLEARDDGDMYMDKLNDAFNRFISRDGKLTVETLYYSLNNMHYDATLGDMLFKLLLQRYGYIGVKYPSGTNYKTSSTKQGDMNYTVFNDSDIKMKKRWDL